MQSLGQRLKPLLTGAVTLSDLDHHTRQALEVYVHFKASAMLDLPGDEMKRQGEALPECVRGLVRDEARRLLKLRRLE